MRTRSLETRQVVAAPVINAEVLEADGASLLLRTVALKIGRATPDSLEPLERTFLGETEGRLRIDALSDHVIRVRYAEGGDVPENKTPMVAGELGAPSRSDIDLSEAKAVAPGETTAVYVGVAGGGEVSLSTGALTVTVFLAPFRLEVRDLQGRKICGMGGPEKNHFRNWDSYSTGIARTTEDEAPVAVQNFDLAYDECIYGLGERFIKINKVGQTIDLNMMEALGTTTPRAYKNVPFFVSNKGYGVYFNHSCLMTCWVGSMAATDVQVAAEDDFLDCYVITGSIKEVLARYTDITGKGALPPKWSFGFWQSKISYSSAEETLEIARTLRERGIPCDVIHLDTHWFKEDWYCDLEFAQDRFPDPEALIEDLAKLGIKVSLWQLPYIPEGSKLFDDLKAVGGFVKRADGETYDIGYCQTPGFKGVVGVIDFTNPAARRVYGDALRRLFRLGAKAIKTDFGEFAPLDGVYHDGTSGHRMHNLYPLLYNSVVWPLTKEETGDGIVWARSAWAGNQRYPVHWGGDNSPNFPNMCPEMEGGLSFGLSGFQFWSQDIGGFMGFSSDQLLVRWMQWGMFMSHCRIHGFGDREIYKFAPETERICREYVRLRYRLLPYIYGSAMKCVEESLPMLRALVIEYQDDPNVWSLGDEYLFGDSLLVAPVFTEDGRRRVYLPEGVWTDWWSKERIAGPRWMDVDADIETIPLYIREGGIIPMGPVMNYVDEVRTEKIDLFVSPFETEGHNTFRVPVNDELVDVNYAAVAGEHTVSIGRSAVAFQVHVLGQKNVSVTTRRTET
jgi:alpha-D-xyloside xylohydrolase